MNALEMREEKRWFGKQDNDRAASLSESRRLLHVAAAQTNERPS